MIHFFATKFAKIKFEQLGGPLASISPRMAHGLNLTSHKVIFSCRVVTKCSNFWAKTDFKPIKYLLGATNYQTKFVEFNGNIAANRQVGMLTRV